ncbi:MAG: proline racemase family protein, partial [Deinococcales bacterium]
MGHRPVHVIDSHTAGEPTRVVVDGGPDLGSGSMAQRLERFRRDFDRFRSAVVSEPRGSDVLVGALLQEPVDADAAEKLRGELARAGSETEVLQGAAGLEQVASAPGVDAVMAAIVGAAGLPATLAAARAGKRVLLANKEALVMAGALFMGAVRDAGALLLPIDSEHNAIFQCLPVDGGARPGLAGVERILLTASGGPFRSWSLDRIRGATVAEACAHPNWSMGRKISVDSATLMNKGLELAEACWLFGVGPAEVTSTEPSRYCTMEWMMLCGCTT